MLYGVQLIFKTGVVEFSVLAKHNPTLFTHEREPHVVFFFRWKKLLIATLVAQANISFLAVMVNNVVLYRV
ncbi:MAG: hypothetical protein JWR21_1111 [Herminiimonas sp.]|nr:hypothetical protein [Herminiimonas sp.]